MKKIISLILCVVMVVSLLPMNALALDLPEMDVLEDVVEAVETAETEEHEADEETSAETEETVPEEDAVGAETPEGSAVPIETEISDDIVSTDGSIMLYSGSEYTEIFAGGDGSEANPYQVATAEQLDAVRYHLDAHYIQTADIDLSNREWEPIGYRKMVIDGNSYYEDKAEFSGCYDGNGYVIKNMTISCRVDGNFILGLFAINTGTIKNIVLCDAYISVDISNPTYSPGGATYATCIGSISGKNSGTITSCSCTGNITITGAERVFVGGVVGSGSCSDCINWTDISVYGVDYKESAEASCIGGIIGFVSPINRAIENCVNYGDVFASADTFLSCGGISGRYGQISNSVNYGNISGEIFAYTSYSGFAANCNVGGVVGSTSSGKNDNCVNYGNIAATRSCKDGSCYAGGIAGWIGYDGSGTISNCYNLGNAITAHSKAGRIAGYLITSKTTNCYSLSTATVNGDIPTEIGTTTIHGESLAKSEMLSAVENILSALNLPLDVVDAVSNVVFQVFDNHLNLYFEVIGEYMLGSGGILIKDYNNDTTLARVDFASLSNIPNELGEQFAVDYDSTNNITAVSLNLALENTPIPGTEKVYLCFETDFLPGADTYIASEELLSKDVLSWQDVFYGTLDGWCIPNNNEGLKWNTIDNYFDRLDNYFSVFKDFTVRWLQGFQALLPIEGLCFGMSLLAGSNSDNTICLKGYFETEGESLSEYGYMQIQENDQGQYFSLSNNSAILELINRAQASQFSKEFTDTRVFADDDDYSKLIDYINSENAGPLLITMEGKIKESDKKVYHAVLLDPSYGVQTTEDGIPYITLCDPNAPQGGEFLDNPHEWYNRLSVIFLWPETGKWLYNSYSEDYECLKAYGNEYAYGGHEYIRFYDISKLNESFFTSQLTLDMLDSKGIWFFSDSILIKDDNSTLLSITDNDIDEIHDDYEYNSYFGENTTSGVPLRWMSTNSDILNYSSSDAAVLVSNPDLDSVYSIENSGACAIYTDTMNKETVIIALDDSELRMHVTAGDNNEDTVTLEFTLMEDNETALVHDNHSLVISNTNPIDINITYTDNTGEEYETCIELNGDNTIRYEEILDIDEESGVDLDCITDEAFRAYITDNFDTDDDGILSESEIEAVSYIDCGNLGIKSLDGIEVFTNLETLYCGCNNLTELDVSNLGSLVELDCWDNNLTELNLSGCENLKVLYCQVNELTSLDVSHNTELVHLLCYDNQLTELNLWNNPHLVLTYQEGEESISNGICSYYREVPMGDGSTGVYTYYLDVDEATMLNIFSWDVNGDSSTNSLDLVAILKHVVGAEDAENSDAIDFNVDGKVDILDVIRLIRYLAGMI